MHAFNFAGHAMVACADRALYWPAQGALLVADLHLEKASWFAARGQMLPPYDSAATLERLTRLADRTGARAIWCLGDSFHDDGGPARLPAAARQALDRLAARTHMHWITGNHDSGAALPGERLVEADLAGVILRHEASTGEQRPELSGHFHPKLRVKTAARSIARPCFVVDDKRIILPAYGALTGGLDAGDPAIRGLFATDAAALVATESALLRFTLPPICKAPKRTGRAQ